MQLCTNREGASCNRFCLRQVSPVYLWFSYQSSVRPQTTGAHLQEASPRLQRMLLRLQKYDITIRYVKGKHLYIADTLSRAHQCDSDEDIDSTEIHLAVHNLLHDLPITEERLADIQQATNEDSQLQRLRQLIEQGWPQNINNVPKGLHGFWKVRENLYVANNLILMSNRLVIPASRQPKVLQSIHEGHLGI